MSEKLIGECKTIENNCIQTAETHHILALKYKCLGLWFQLIPALIAAVSATLILGNIIADSVIWLTAISAVIATVSNVLDPQRYYYDHLTAAKNFTVMKHNARALYSTFGVEMTADKFSCSVFNLHERYNDLVRFAPPTNEKAYKKAKKRVEEGVHNND